MVQGLKLKMPFDGEELKKSLTTHRTEMDCKTRGDVCGASRKESSHDLKTNSEIAQNKF